MKKKHAGTQIVAGLRQADVLVGQGKTVPEVCKEIEVAEQTYYRWRQKYGGMSPESAQNRAAGANRADGSSVKPKEGLACLH